MAQWKKLIHNGKQLFLFLRPMGIPVYSAYTAFFLVLSLFPSLILFLGILKRLDVSIADLLDFLSGLLPRALVPTAEALARSTARSGTATVLSISVLAALWSASRGMFGLLNGLNAIYGGPADRGYWKRRGISVVYTGLFLIVLALTLIAHIFGTAILDYLWMTTHPLLLLILRVIDLRFVLLLILQTSLFTAMYALLSGKRRRLRDCFPGAALASLGWLVCSDLFSVYMEYPSGYTDTFGSVYILALGMLWLYFCICILFYGSALNRWLEENGK